MIYDAKRFRIDRYCLLYTSILCKGFCCWTHELHPRKRLCIHWPGWLFAETVKVRWLRHRPALVAKSIATIFVILTKSTKAVPAVIEFPKANWGKLSWFFSGSISVWLSLIHLSVHVAMIIRAKSI